MLGRTTDFIGSLAAVAIATLAGPLPAMGAVAIEQFFGLVVTKIVDGEPTRELRQKLKDAIEQWASSENLDAGVRELGLEQAARTVSQFGTDTKTIAELGYDTDRIATQVIDAAKATDRFWGTERHYDVAERAIRATYSLLIGQMRGKEPILLPALEVQHKAVIDQLEQLEQTVRALAASQVDPASRLELLRYLRERIEDWDRSPWRDGRQPSELERRLRVHTRETQPKLMSDDAVLSDSRLVVVLGGPGAGKSWLARRWARTAAQKAIDQIETGAALETVEIPVLTTWDRWIKTPGDDARQSLIASSFATGSGTTPPVSEAVGKRLRRSLTDQRTRVLMVVDSLDEAATTERQQENLYTLTRMPSCRVVITSREGAWQQTAGDRFNGGESACVAELHPLDYPDDVDSFIKEWFDSDPASSAALTEQLSDHPELQRAATVPLLLTFYCIIAEPRSADRMQAAQVAVLPARRHELYDSLVKRLLVGKWKTEGSSAPVYTDECLQILSEWAWAAVGQANRPHTGLADWGERFPRSQPAPPALATALDHVAPVVDDDDEGTSTYQFVHRTVLEHFVAEYIGSLSAAEAAEVLIPHLWFDSDWRVAAPATIAVHNRRAIGELFELVESQCPGFADIPALGAPPSVLQEEVIRLVLGIAAESEEADWLPRHRGVIHQYRIVSATTSTDALLRSSHWSSSNEEVCEVLLNRIPTAGQETIEIASTIAKLTSSPETLTPKRARVGKWIEEASEADRARLAGAFSALAPTLDECAALRRVLIAGVAHAPANEVVGLAPALVILGAGEVECAQVRPTVIERLRQADPFEVSDLIPLFVRLGATQDERAEVSGSLLEQIGNLDPLKAGVMVSSAVELAITPAERDALVETLSARMPTAGPGLAGELAGALVRIDADPDTLTLARATLLDTVPNAQPTEAARVAYIFHSLTPTAAERARLGAALLIQFRAAGVIGSLNLAPAVVQFSADTAVRTEVGSKLVELIAAAEDSSVLLGMLVDALVALIPTAAELATIQSATLRILSSADASTAAWLVSRGFLQNLAPGDRVALRDSWIDLVSGTDGEDISRLVAAITRLGPTPSQFPTVRAAIARRLAARPADTDRLVQPLRETSTPDEWTVWLAG